MLNFFFGLENIPQEKRRVITKLMVDIGLTPFCGGGTWSGVNGHVDGFIMLIDSLIQFV